MRGIYKIINVVNNKFYVGSAVNFKTRKARHWNELRKGKHNNGHLQAAWNKYGEQAFTFVIVQELNAEDDLLAAENVWLKDCVGRLECYNIGTNATAPLLGVTGEAHPVFGYKHTPDTLKRIGETSKGRTFTEEVNKRKTAHLHGKPKSIEVRAKISKTLSGAGNPNYGKPRSAEFKEKVSKAIIAVLPSGAIMEFPSITMLRSALDITPPTVNRALKAGKPLTKGAKKGWTFFYKENYNYDIAFPDGAGPRNHA